MECLDGLTNLGQVHSQPHNLILDYSVLVFGIKTTCVEREREAVIWLAECWAAGTKATEGHLKMSNNL